MYDIKFVFNGNTIMHSRWNCPPRTGEFVDFGGCMLVIETITYKVIGDTMVVVARLSET